MSMASTFSPSNLYQGHVWSDHVTARLVLPSTTAAIPCDTVAKIIDDILSHLDAQR